VIAARIGRTLAYQADKHGFARLLVKDIEKLKRKAEREHMQLAVRINGTSDLPGLAREVHASCPGVRFYDYTKIYGVWHHNAGIHYTFSRSEKNDAQCRAALYEGINVAVVFSTKRGARLPRTYTLPGWGPVSVIDGDLNDLRFRDQEGVIVGLRAKGRARSRDTHGFVVQVE